MGSPRCTASRKRSPDRLMSGAPGMGASVLEHPFLKRCSTHVASVSSSHRSHSLAGSHRRDRSPGITFPFVAHDGRAEGGSQARRGGPQRRITPSRRKTAAAVGEVESRLPAPVWTDDLEIAGHRCRTGRSAGAGTFASCLGAKRRYLRRRTQPLLKRDGRGSLDVKRVGHWSAAGDAMMRNLMALRTRDGPLPGRPASAEPAGMRST
jgi:hypothetical protein